MEFPKLDGNPSIDDIISKCWHTEYTTVSELAAHTKALLYESPDAGNNGVRSRDEAAREAMATSIETMHIFGWSIPIGRMVRGLLCRLEDWWTVVSQRTSNEATNNELAGGDTFDDADQGFFGFRSEKEFCQDLEKRGLLDLLFSGETEQIGFTLEWYRHSEMG
ncbi:STYKc [Aspergillus sclerotialis]|uniref:STYKc n=1 Tax=Aspergillus sclerotialis TaxID=2070753 RepID=A0A3A2ZKK1_9EURO|nr:STYKc [Aspergillus sclerotialis]